MPVYVDRVIALPATALRRFSPVADAAVAQSDIYGQLRRAVLHARFQPGQLISLRAIAAEFGTSPMPVREAASRLVAEGAFEAISRRGFRVPLIDAAQAAQIIALRVELEGRAAAAAAVRIDRAQVRELKRLELGIEAAVDGGNIPAILAANTDFHLAVYRAAEDATLMQLIEILLLRYAPNLAATIAQLPREQLGTLFDSTHGALLIALGEGDGAAARRAIEEDILQAAEICWGARPG